MEVKFAQMLDEHGVTSEQTTTKIRDLKNVFDEAWSSYLEILDNYKSCTDVAEKEVLMEEINEFEADLQEADQELVKKINEWVKNKDKWEENKRKMAEGRARKAAKASAEPAPAPLPVSGTTTVQSGANTTSVSQPVNEPQMASAVHADGGKVEEESSNTGWWLLAGFVAVVTLGAVVMKRS